MLGLTMRARKLISGEDSVIDAVRSGKARLVLLASDASANTAKKVTDKCRYYEVPCHTASDRYQLGRAIGKEARVVLAVTDDNLADRIRRLLTPNP
ncbi:YlxQ family RNA-binding protein [Brevibacillus humidisoli]|uniref:YlxQ family RNA-binding protein n=1 Tax=Brevibacillus humidisoli TaxID=2895522 RepID=UPI0030BA0133